MRRKWESYLIAIPYLPASVTASLHTLGEQHGLTMNTLVQAGWALLLNHHSGSTDVLFGATVSGRPPEIVAVESIVGLFINTLPIRIQMKMKMSPSADGSLLSWLQAIQNQNLAQQPHSYCSTGQIHQWSEVPAALPLYESLLVFENYPIDSSEEQPISLDGERFEMLEEYPCGARDGDSIGAQTNYALTILVLPGSELGFNFVYDTSRFEAADISQLLTNLLTLFTKMEKITTAPQQPLTTFLPSCLGTCFRATRCQPFTLFRLLSRRSQKALSRLVLTLSNNWSISGRRHWASIRWGYEIAGYFPLGVGGLGLHP